MADREIDLKIVLDDNGAIQTINGVDQAIKKTQDSAESLGSTFGQHLGAAAGQVFSGIKLGAVAAAAALTGMGVAAGSALNLAREVEDLAGGFDTLSERVGNFSDEKLAKLQSATQGLTTELDIMRAANQAVLLGVDDGSGKFEEMAAAAVKLGNAMGITTTEALNSLVLGIGRGSKMILDNLGIVVDLDTAYKNFADTNGLLASKLTEAQKDLAFQAEAMKQIKEGADALPPSAETAANAYERLTTTIADSRGDFATGVSGSDDLKEALNNFDIALGSIDFSELGQKFGDFVSEMVNYASLIALNYKDMIQDAEIFKAQILAILSFSSPTAAAETILGNAALQNQVDGMLDFTNAKEKLDELGQYVGATFNNIAGSSTKEIAELQKQLVSIREDLGASGVAIDPAIAQQYQGIRDDLENLATQVPKTSEGLKNLSGNLKSGGDAAKKAANDFEKFTDQISEISNTKAGGAFEQISKDATAFGVALATNAISVKDFNEQLALLGKKTGKEGFKVIIDGAKAGEKAVESVNDEVEKLLNGVDSFNEFDQPVAEVFDAFRNGEIDVQAVQEQIELLILKTGGSIEEIERLKQALEKLPEPGKQDQGFLGGLFTPPTKDQLKGFNDELGSALAGGMSDAISAALNGGDVREALSGLGQSLGGVLGNAAGGPGGAALGSLFGGFISKELSEAGKSSKDSAEVLGGFLGQAVAGPFGAAIGFSLGGLFGGMSKDEKLRRAFGDGFNKLIEESGIETVLPDDILNTDNIQERFDSLDIASNLIPQFDGISAALATTFGLLEEGGETMLSQFSQILAVNYQNASGLNDLQIILQRSGLDAETLKQNLEEAYLSGELAAGAFLNATAQVENLYAQGIPGALGATSLAFDNFVNNALYSGADAKDAVGDLGAEMTEALNGGVTTLAELQERLIAQGADATKVAQFFEAAARAGISTIEQLTNVTTAQAANITASLQGVQGFFAETSNQVAELENQLNGLDGKEINIKVKYSSEYDSSATQSAIEGGTIGGEGPGAG